MTFLPSEVRKGRHDSCGCQPSPAATSFQVSGTNLIMQNFIFSEIFQGLHLFLGFSVTLGDSGIGESIANLFFPSFYSFTPCRPQASAPLHGSGHRGRLPHLLARGQQPRAQAPHQVIKQHHAQHCHCHHHHLHHHQSRDFITKI